MFSIDGSVVATHADWDRRGHAALVSDLLTTDGALSVDWVRMTPYATGRHLHVAGSRRWLGGHLAVDVLDRAISR